MSVEEHAGRQGEFLEKELEPVLCEAVSGARQVYFVDAAHFVLGSFLCCLWCAARMFIRGGAGRQRHNVLGAWNAATGRLIAVVNDTVISSAQMCELLGKISLAHPGGNVTLVLDNARYQKCAVVMAEAARLGVDLKFLPSYSPNLNLIERLWRHVRKEALHGRHFAKFEDFKAAIDRCLFEPTGRQVEKLKSLMTLKFQMFDKEVVLAA
jgi:transposase